MDVFLIPVGQGRYELYYEPPDEEPSRTDEPHAPGFFRQWSRRFGEMLREAEQERHRSVEAVEAPGLLARARQRMMRFIVERIAEWRLLWHLRSADEVTAHVPADMDPGDAERLMRAMLKADADRHRRWLIVDLLLLAASAPLALVPGPNVLAYYFTFNVVGHFLAMRGARRGLSQVTWRVVPTEALSELRRVLALGEPHRERTLHEVATRLRLQHLARFFRRIAVRTA
jgi:Mitochondrial K+-H+ exchange-related